MVVHAVVVTGIVTDTTVVILVTVLIAMVGGYDGDTVDDINPALP